MHVIKKCGYPYNEDIWSGICSLDKNVRRDIVGREKNMCRDAWAGPSVGPRRVLVHQV